MFPGYYAPAGGSRFSAYRRHLLPWLSPEYGSCRLEEFRLLPKRYRAWIAGILTPSLGGVAIWSRPLEIFTLRLLSAVTASRSRLRVFFEERACSFSGLALAAGSRGWLAYSTLVWTRGEHPPGMVALDILSKMGCPRYIHVRLQSRQ